MSECKHGMKSGCVYCHARPVDRPALRPAGTGPRGTARRTSRSTRLSEQMNDRMTALAKRLRELRGQS
jgi:hypothetical protein